MPVSRYRLKDLILPCQREVSPKVTEGEEAEQRFRIPPPPSGWRLPPPPRGGGQILVPAEAGRHGAATKPATDNWLARENRISLAFQQCQRFDEQRPKLDDVL